MKTIARNRAKKIAEIAAAATGVRMYDQSTGNMVASTAQAAFAALAGYDYARLRDRENGTYVVEVHSNLWYELDTRPQTAPEQADRPAADVERDARRREVRNARTLARTVSIHDLGKPATTALTRKAIGTQLAEALDALGVAYTTGYAGGAGYYEVDGTSYTAGALADLVLEGGFDAAYGRAETRVFHDSPLKPRPAVTVEDVAEWQVDDEQGGTGEVEPADRAAEVRHVAESIRQNATAWDEAHAEEAGRGILARETPLGRQLAGLNAQELTRVERRALRGGVTRPAARPAEEGLRTRGLVVGGRGDGPLRLTAMGEAVTAILRGASVPA